MERGNYGERVRGDYSRHNPTLRDLPHAVISGVLFEGELKGRTRQGHRLGAAVISLSDTQRHVNRGRARVNQFTTQRDVETKEIRDS
jgi:hypothetical protein